MITYADMKKRNEEIGHSWFDDRAIAFFNTRFEGEPITVSTWNDVALFVTSEQDTSTHAAWNGERRFSVRIYSAGQVDTVGEFGQHATLLEATDVIQGIVNTYYEEGTPSWDRR